MYQKCQYIAFPDYLYFQMYIALENLRLKRILAFGSIIGAFFPKEPVMEELKSHYKKVLFYKIWGCSCWYCTLPFNNFTPLTKGLQFPRPISSEWNCTVENYHNPQFMIFYRSHYIDRDRDVEINWYHHPSSISYFLQLYIVVISLCFW